MRAAHGGPKAPVVLPKASVDLEAKSDWTCWFADSFKDARVIVACIAIAAAAWSVLARWQSYCISEEGLCSTTPCSCADRSQVMRKLRTPEGLDCWQCLDYCPAGQANGLNSSNQSCHRGFCECADPMQERTLSAASSIEDPCWQCTTPAPVVSLRMPGEPNTSCLVRAPRSQIVALGGRATRILSQPETLMRLVMASENNVSENGSVSAASCASFVREDLFLREKKTRLCLSWSPSGHTWGLGKCEAQSSEESQLQSFARSGEAFCIQGTTAGMNSAACVDLRSNMCTSEAGLCTPAPCECENSSRKKHEIVLEGGGSCWSCALPAPLYCSTEPQVCTTAECECQDPSHEKILSKTTEKPVRTCWSCHPQGSAARRSGIYSRAMVTVILVSVFICSLWAGLTLRRNTYSHATSQKGRKGGKAPKTWLDRIAWELEEVWCLFKDSAFTIGQACRTMLNQLRKWKRAAATAVADRVKSLGEWVNARTAPVSSTLSSETPASSSRGSQPGTSKDAHHAEGATAEARTEPERGETPPQPDPPQRSDETAEIKAEPLEEGSVDQPSDECSTPSGTAWDELGLNCENISGSLQHARLLMMLSNALHSGAQVDKKSLAAKWLLLHHTSQAKDAEQAAQGACRAGQRARGKRGDRNQEAGLVAEEEEADGEEDAVEEEEEGVEAAEVVEVQRRRKSGRNRKALDQSRAEARTSDQNGTQPGGWDPLGLQSQDHDASKGAVLEQARVMMLGAPSWCLGARSWTHPRVLAASWLVLKHMPESRGCLGLPGSSRASSSKILGTDKLKEAEAEPARKVPDLADAAPTQTDKQRRCSAGGSSSQSSSPKDVVLPESNIKVQRTFIEVPDSGEDDDTPLNSKLKKSVSCGDVPKMHSQHES
eukprot:TRINITY_DN16922_c0_g1_i1.p1 TRINITY_DN16922_c0_g1~~TRINITY_DN16922_c0_g1_i1.p1  ORF type:complete len:888 (-),score=138.68 TRINITY_DN16922_c0_g1_i1:203-2866(-)